MKRMKEYSTSLLFQFSITCFVIIFTIVLVIGLVFTERLEANAGIGFLVLSFALIAILLNGSRTISQQQSDLRLSNIGLEARVAERVEELRETNLRLTSEIWERGRRNFSLRKPWKRCGPCNSNWCNRKGCWRWDRWPAA